MKFACLCLVFLLSTAVFAAQKAVTDTGQEVILNDDGTWQIAGDGSTSTVKIDTNETAFTKPASSSFLLKSTVNSSGFWMNTEKWAFKKATNNAEAEYEFSLKGSDLYGMAITEAVEISMEVLADIAVANARNVAPDIQVVKKEYRNVNGKRVVYMEMGGTMQSTKFMYLGYYYSDSTGSTQLISYTGANLVEKYRPEIDEFLNGLTIL